LQVSFDASGMDGAKARVDVFDMKGSVVASASQRCVDGINAFSLEMPRRGLYTVRVAVAGSVATRRILLR
ncbi:T9SS type A sorting domain-containing protein, partial [Candidatus Saccharibacteria bacterium]|nr:T9SS type A sorting domain-containing protein [Candidatus Saccharibacteria bacterium]